MSNKRRKSSGKMSPGPRTNPGKHKAGVTSNTGAASRIGVTISGGASRAGKMSASGKTSMTGKTGRSGRRTNGQINSTGLKGLQLSRAFHHSRVVWTSGSNLLQASGAQSILSCCMLEETNGKA